MLQIADVLIAPEAVSPALSKPLAVIDLDACPADAGVAALPMCPIVGIGNSEHPLARRLDALIESPISLETVMRQVTRVPHAAATLVHLLRSIEGQAPEQALIAESLCYGLLQGSGEHGDWLARRTRSKVAAHAGQLGIARCDDVLHLAIDRPSARNAIDRHLRDQLHEAFTLAALDPDIKAIRLCATGAIFSVGADLDEFGTTRDPATAHGIRMRTLPAWPLLRCADRLEVYVQGGCVGSGLEMAAFAGRLTASADAWFQLPELAMGIVPGAGGCVSVSNRIGRQRAALMILSGRRITATTALRWGLIDRIEDTPPGDDGGADEI